MFSITQEMDIRLSETQSLIDLSKGIEQGLIESNCIRFNLPVIRSTVILSLYNVVESTITQVLARIHDEIISKKVSYNNLNKCIKDIVLVYFYKYKEKRSDIHDALDVLHNTVDMIRGKGFFEIEYNVMAKSYQLYSGNLDAKIIRKIMKKYGIIIPESIGTKLNSVKNGRNKLAHGEQSFEEYGRNVVLNVLESYLADVRAFLEEVISKTEEFLNNEAYRKPRRKTNTKNKKRR
ncbi:MAE_28990/MAE_18760 family HEPN-like nuclease [Pseudoalteromonas rubra]|uniref:MAE_28990/MAE_18760 family HEPN-like nuclease n=1 Tax=Pseudoalteromonas rubra TaxID=43658 RepID=UPI000F772420|nr:MAE_28990/MAE_18760 family HEPN-like nuclease [Pseudoalteromonas rubra]